VIGRVLDPVLARPRALLACCLAMTLVAAYLASGIEMRTSRRELAPRDDPDQRRLAALEAELVGRQPLIVAVEAATSDGSVPVDLIAASDAIAAALAREPLVEGVFHRIDAEWVAEHLLWLVPPGRLEQLSVLLERLGGETAGNGWPRDWAEINDSIAMLVERAVEQPGSAAGSRGSAEATAGLVRILEIERRFFADPHDTLRSLADGSALAPMGQGGVALTNSGYLATRDGSMLFLLVTPADGDDSIPAHTRLVSRVREVAGEAAGGFPGVSVELTGEPALVVDEMAAVRRDTVVTSLLALAGVTVLALLAFRWRSHALLAVAVLGMAVVWSLGAVRLEIGYLNLVTSAFLSTLIGVGISYAIHPLSEYEIAGAHSRDPAVSTRHAYRATGAAVVVSALTTAGAFFAITLMDFRGFQELAVVAGIGILLCLVAVMFALPALLVLHGRWRARGDFPARRDPPPVDRLWMDRLSRHLCRFPRATTAVAALVTLAAATSATGLRFDHDLLDLLPERAGSLRALERLTSESDLSPHVNFVVAGTLSDLEALRERALAHAEIARFESVLDLLPEQPHASAAVIARLRPALERLGRPRPAGGFDPSATIASLERLRGALDAATEAAFVAGEADSVAGLAEARALTVAIADRIAGADEATTRDWSEALRRLGRSIVRANSLLTRAASSEPPAPGRLPEEVRKRLVTRDGRFVGLLHPRGDVYDPEFLRRFNRASRELDERATGFPITFEVMSARITGGFYRAFGAGVLLVLAVLLVDFRRPGPPVMALVPLAIGIVWMLGAMRVVGLSFNLANLIALPLILGIGIDNGVHVVHRLRLEGERGMDVVLRHTGRAILVASLTTMVGFGSLSLASHRGLRSLGLILLIGIFACLLTSTVVLPNLLVALGRFRR
jgi:predicted RND superfamily exporter protein